MKNSPLQLDRAHVGELHLTPHPLAVPFHTGVSVNCQVNYGRSEDNARQWLCELRVEFKSDSDQPIPYTGFIIVRGFFTLLTDLPEPRQLQLIAVTCPSILYGTARESIATLTGRSTFGVFLLPAVSFSDHTISIETDPAKMKSMTVPL
jgi:preprotein translocase subunit SecB